MAKPKKEHAHKIKAYKYEEQKNKTEVVDIKVAYCKCGEIISIEPLGRRPRLD